MRNVFLLQEIKGAIRHKSRHNTSCDNLFAKTLKEKCWGRATTRLKQFSLGGGEKVVQGSLLKKKTQEKKSQDQLGFIVVYVL